MRKPLQLSGLILTLAVAFGAWLVIAFAALLYGSSGLGPLDLLAALGGGGLDDMQRAVLVHARLPRVFFAGIVGAALAVAGAVFQAVLRNPLADPYILGISGGAALGGTLLLTLGAFTLGGAVVGAGAGVVVGVPLAAFIGAMGALLVIFVVESWAPPGNAGTYVLLLTGVIVNAFAASIIMFLKSIVSAQKAQELLFYLMGALAVEGTSTAVMVVVGVVIAACIAGLMWFARDLNIMTLGDDEAASLGVDAARTRKFTVVLASVAVAVAVAYSGIIGFVGLVVPHGIRLVVGADHRVLLPACALGGAAFLTLADLIARSAFGVFSTTLPVGVITSAVGAPLFLYFLWRSLKHRGGLL